MKETGLYIHIPYCRSKCIYCDFYSGGSSAANWGLLTDSLLSELRSRTGEMPAVPDTIYIGGGTPSLMPPREFDRLVEGVRNETGVCGDLHEFTLEVNPDDVDDEKCRVWKDAGVNRLSMGIQSFSDVELKAIKRRHDSACAKDAYSVIARHFDNVSIDLMFGLPFQTQESWKQTVEEAIRLTPAHLSAYSLMFEEGTALSLLKSQGRLTFPSDEDSVGMWKFLSSRLSEAGYRQYEISNYSKPGRESVHNTRYWLGNPYLGIGPSAHSYDGVRTRRANPCDLKRYYEAYGHGGATVGDIYSEETLSDEELKEEMLLTRMRMRCGLDVSEFENRFGKEEKRNLLKNAEPFLRDATLISDNGRMKLTDDGIMIADEIIVGLSM